MAICSSTAPQIYEYRPSMIHTKSLVVDGLWSVVGSTNFDHRSFGINDEVNLAALDERSRARGWKRISSAISRNRTASPIANGCNRSPFERFHEWLGWILERQE